MSNQESKEVPDTLTSEGANEGSEVGQTLSAEACEEADAAENRVLRKKGKLSGEQRVELFRLYKQGCKKAALNKKFGVSYPTTTKVIKEMEEEERKRALAAQDEVPAI